MDIGSLRDIITIQEPTRVTSGSGSVTETWAAVCTNLRADARPMSGDETYKAGNQLSGKAGYKVTIRYRTGIRTNMRIYFEPECVGQYLDVLFVWWDRRRSRMELTCTMNEADGTRNQK